MLFSRQYSESPRESSSPHPEAMGSIPEVRRFCCTSAPGDEARFETDSAVKSSREREIKQLKRRQITMLTFFPGGEVSVVGGSGSTSACS